MKQTQFDPEDPNGPHWTPIAPKLNINRPKMTQMDANLPKWTPHGPKWTQMDPARLK